MRRVLVFGRIPPNYLSGMRAWSQSPLREAEGLSRLHNTITDWPDSGYTRRIAFIRSGSIVPPARANKDTNESYFAAFFFGFLFEGSAFAVFFAALASTISANTFSIRRI